MICYDSAMKQPVKHVVSVSLGSPSRDIDQQINLLGQDIHLERRGCDSNLNKAAKLIREIDGKVDAIGLGGIDLYISTGDKHYQFRQAAYLAKQAKITPVVCGAGLKQSLESYVIQNLAKGLNLPQQRVLLVSAVDRFGMAKALVEAGADCRFADLMFALKLPITISSLKNVATLGAALLPILTQLPISWLYPTGEKQTSEKKALPKFIEKAYDWATVIAGDWHFIRRYSPKDLSGKIILTNTTTSQDIEFLRSKGAKSLITTTPRFNGRSLATNLLEAALIAVSERYPLNHEDYLTLIQKADLKGDILHF
ncbi:MAG: quinate 5-dehydrogenase [Deinococcales bacterium]